MVNIGSEALDKVQAPTVMQKLQGQVAELTIQNTEARPGEAMQVRVRGENSLTANNDPLIIMDGIPYSGSLNDIDPGIIESISVLKDASSSAIYGSRAANGVILITTQKGKKGQARVTYKGSVGISQVERRLNLMKGDEYVKYIQDYERIKNGLTGDQLDPLKILNPSERENWKNGLETDWQDVIFRNALTHSHQIGISGGSDKTTYYGAVSYMNEEGVVRNTGFERATVALNIDQTFNDWLTVGMGTQFIHKSTGGIAPRIESATRLSPYGSIKDDRGDWLFYPMDQTLYENPMADVDAIHDNIARNAFISAYANVKLPVEGLSYRANFGYNYRTKEEGKYYGRNTLTGSIVNGRAEVAGENYYDWTFENLLNYNREFGQHKIGATGLFSLQATRKSTNDMSGEEFVNDDSEYHNIALAEKNVKIASGLTETSLVSYMGRINYGYANKYLVTLTLRGDGYSSFGKNNKWATFPSVALAWVMSQEEFMSGTNHFLDQLKFRLSYGANGNQAINAYQTMDRLSQTKYIWGEEEANGVYLGYSGVGNPNLRWETTYSTNFGIDFSLWNGRVSGNLEYYHSRTKDLLMSRNVPVMNGYNSILYNVGETQNKGIEVTVKTVNVTNDDFRWSSTFNFSRNRDKIVKLRGDGKDDIANKWFLGQPLRVYYDYKVIGVWQNNDDPALMAKYGAKPGDARLLDVDKNGKIDADDKVIIGSRLPDFTMSFGNELAYKNFTLSILMNGVFGVTKVNPYPNIERWMTGYNYMSGMNYWTPENNHASIPSPDYKPTPTHDYYKDVNYWKIRNITLGYNLPKRVTDKMHIQGLNVYAGVNNVYTFSNIKGLNVEAPVNKLVSTSYPTARSYTMGLNLTF